ncbi:unnamed protein product, partial [Anisakis simplex]|uniref:Xpo1 domain-containing protein n=1 Tax=Anisakis simplex TaxID=6269 RepID=A0A0M3KEW9_ANISI
MCTISDYDDKDSAPQSAFEILLEVERTPLTLTDYRNRLMLLRKLLFGAHEKHMPKCTNDALETVPLRVIIAQLFERFTIYWPPLFEIIESYAYGMKLNQFWPIFVAFIEDATKHLVSSAVEDERCTRTDSTARIFDQLCDVSSSRSPDYGMFRLQMFNLLSKLDEIAEKTTKTLSPWLLALYTQEYESVDFMSRNRQNITWTNPSACELNAAELDGENDEEDGDEEM